MDEQLIRQACRQLVQNVELVYLSTVDENNSPQTRAMGNLRNLDQFARLTDFFKQQTHDFVAYMTTNRLSLKMEQIRHNPQACLYYCNFAETHGLSLLGKMEVVNDTAIRQVLWQDDYYQFYQGGLNGQDYTVLRVIPVLAKGWYKTDKFEFRISE